jgi:hypothetical protein
LRGVIVKGGLPGLAFQFRLIGVVRVGIFRGHRLISKTKKGPKAMCLQPRYRVCHSPCLRITFFDYGYLYPNSVTMSMFNYQIGYFIHRRYPAFLQTRHQPPLFQRPRFIRIVHIMPILPMIDRNGGPAKHLSISDIGNDRLFSRETPLFSLSFVLEPQI